MPSGAELFVRSIAELGISQIFTLVGDHLNEVLAVAAREGIRILDMRHESGVTHAADAWARLSRKPAISLVTGGPGHTNSLTGIATANLAASPLIAGSGVWWADAASELREFIERTSLPLYTITMAKGVVSDEHPLCMGYADPALNQAVHTAFKEADLFLVLGKRIDYRLALGGPRLFAPGARFIQVDIHAPELGMNRKLELGICADVRSTLLAMTASIEKPWTPLPWLDRLRQLRGEWEAKLAEASQDRTMPLHPAAFFAELKKCLPQDLYYAWDGG